MRGRAASLHVLQVLPAANGTARMKEQAASHGQTPAAAAGQSQPQHLPVQSNAMSASHDCTMAMPAAALRGISQPAGAHSAVGLQQPQQQAPQHWSAHANGNVNTGMPQQQSMPECSGADAKDSEGEAAPGGTLGAFDARWPPAAGSLPCSLHDEASEATAIPGLAVDPP